MPLNRPFIQLVQMDVLWFPHWMVALPFLVAACSAGAVPDAAPEPVCSVTTVEAARDTRPLTVGVAGVTEPFRRSTPAVRLMAKVLSANFQEGDRVEAGHVLLRLDTRDFQARRRANHASGQAASTALSLAEDSLRRTRALFSSGAIPRVQLEAAELALSQAQAAAHMVDANQDELDFNLESSTVRSPFPGVVVRKLTEVGNLTAPGQPLLVLEDDSRLRVVAPLGAALAGQVPVGADVVVETGGQHVLGTVEAILPSGDPRAPGLRVQVLVNNADHQLRAGTLAVLEIPRQPEAVAALRIPPATVLNRGQLSSAFVSNGGLAQLRWLSLGLSDGQWVQVLSGLSEGERVILRPGDPCLRDGRRVQEAIP